MAEGLILDMDCSACAQRLLTPQPRSCTQAVEAAKIMSKSQEQPEIENVPNKKLTLPKVSIIFLGVFIVWIATPYALRYLHPNLDLPARGQLGDLFGTVNALFSGLAFAGVIVAIILQHEELELQRHEIAANRIELARTATAQEESREALRKTIEAQTFRTAMDLLQAENVRQARYIVLSRLRAVPIELWKEADRSAAETVCHTYNSVGLMVRYKMIPLEYIVDSWGSSIRRTWKVVKPLVKRYRQRRQSGDHWVDYEYLAQQTILRQRQSAAGRPAHTISHRLDGTDQHTGELQNPP